MFQSNYIHATVRKFVACKLKQKFQGGKMYIINNILVLKNKEKYVIEKSLQC